MQGENEKMGLVDRLKEANQGGGTKYLTLGEKSEFGMVARIRILQDLDESAKGYNPKYGLAQDFELHTHPNDFKKSAVCNFDTEGSCWACEQAAGPGKEDWKWKARRVLLANVLATNKAGDQVIKVWKIGVNPKQIGATLLDYFGEYNSISDRDYKYGRKGSGQFDTVYTLLPVEESANDKFDGELIDLTAVLPSIPNERMEEFFVGGAGPFDESTEASTWVE